MPTRGAGMNRGAANCQQSSAPVESARIEQPGPAPESTCKRGDQTTGAQKNPAPDSTGAGMDRGDQTDDQPRGTRRGISPQERRSAARSARFAARRFQYARTPSRHSALTTGAASRNAGGHDQ